MVGSIAHNERFAAWRSVFGLPKCSILAQCLKAKTDAKPLLVAGADY